jgi:multidrug resistance efflux pump
MTEDQTEYERGVAAGQVLSRLDSHDQHLAKINGSMDTVASELKQLNLNVQRMSDAAEADRAKAVVVAEALDKAETNREKTVARRWSPVERLIGLLFALAALISVVAYLIVHFR